MTSFPLVFANARSHLSTVACVEDDRKDHAHLNYPQARTIWTLAIVHCRLHQIFVIAMNNGKCELRIRG